MTAAAGAALSMLTAAGCASRGNVDALESHLRQTQDQLRRSEQELVKIRSERDVARQETELVRQQVASAGVLREAILPEHTQSLSRIANLSINKMMSGGRDSDGDRRDEALQVIVSPLDGDGDLVKIAGKLEIEAYDLSKSGEDKRIGRWQFDAAEARKHWHSGFLSSGFQFHLPWQDSAPQGKDVLVHARLTTSDGRQFDTNQTLLVNAQGAGDRSPVRPVPPTEPGRLAPPPAFQPALEQASGRSSARSELEPSNAFQPLPQMSRPMKKTAEALPLAATRESSQADTTVEVGKANLDFEFDDAPESPNPFRPVSGETVFGSSQGIGSKFEKYRSGATGGETRPEVVPPPRDPEEPRPLPGKSSTARPIAPAVSGEKSEDAPRPLPGKTSSARTIVPATGEKSDDAPRPLPGKPSPAQPVAPLAPSKERQETSGPLPPKMPDARSIERFPQATSSNDAAPPFPRGLSTTSDAWTDETIPRLR